jgi:sugar lactone lactonase YvrE
MKNFVRVYLSALALFLTLAPAAVRAQNITTVAGGGPVGLVATSASVGAPAAVRKDSLGNTYILDNNFGIVFRVDHTTGLMSVFAGNGAPGFSGEGGLAVDASMNGPSGMCIDSSNNVYVADSDNAIIREIPITTAGGKTAGHIYTVAGVETEDDFTFGGDGGPATSANLHFPDGCSFDSHGNLYISDRGNNAVRVVIGASATPPANIPSATTPGNIYEFAGATPAGGNPPVAGYAANGTAALGGMLNGPFDVFVDVHDNVFIADLGNNFPNNPMLPVNNNVIREIPSTTTTTPAMTAFDVYTVAGVQGMVGHTTGILATTALLDQPIGISVDAAGNLFFADSVNQVIREVPAVAATGMTAGFIYDIAGTAGQRGYSGNGIAVSATLSFPAGTYVDSTDSVFIADSNSNAIRQVSSSIAGGYTAQTITTVEGNGHFAFSNATPASAGQLNTPAGVAVGPTGNLLIADVENSVIRGVASPIASGALATLAGSPEFNGFSNTSPFVVNNSLGVFVDPSGNTFVADTGNCIVRKITGATITTIAGVEPTTPDPINHPQVTVPQCGFNAQGGVATVTTLGATVAGNGAGINSVAVDRAGDVFFSDSANNVIWEVPKTDVGTMVAGNAYIVVGTQSTTGAFGGDGGVANAAQLDNPTGIYFDVYGNLFVADTGNNVIREVPAVNVGTMVAGSIYTVAGNQTAGYSGDGAAAISAQLHAPFTVAVDNAEDIFIADSTNQVIREVAGKTAGGKTAGDIYTVAGTHGVAGFAGDGAAATSAQLDSPQGLAIDGSGDLLIGDSVNNRVRSVAAIANVTAVPVTSFSPSTLAFTAQPVGIPSTPQPITLANSGGAAMTVSAIHITGTNAADYGETDNCVGTVAANASCTINVTFTPHALNGSTATLTVTDTAFGSPQSVTLSGTGGSPAAMLNPTSLTFATTVAGIASAPQAVTVTNNGNVATVFSSISIAGTNPGDFTLTPASNCPISPATLAVNGTCTINVTFKPTLGGARAASVEIADNVTGSPQVIALTGTGAAPAVTFAPASIAFGNQTVGVGVAMSTTLTNSGTAPLAITGATVSGVNLADFTLAPTSTCPIAPATLAVNGTCIISVTFKASTQAAEAATLEVVDNVSGSPQMLALSGTGTAPTTFTLALGTSDGKTAQTVTAGSTATYNMQITGTGGTSTSTANVTVTCALQSTLTKAACTVPTSAIAVTPAAAGTFKVTVSTTAATTTMLAPQFQTGRRMQPPAAIQILPLAVLALLFSIVTLFGWMQNPAGRMRTIRVALSVCLVLMPIAAATMIAGCGGGSSSPTPTPTPVPGTPSGTYTVTISATATGATAPTAVTLTLVVQ